MGVVSCNKVQQCFKIIRKISRLLCGDGENKPGTPVCACLMDFWEVKNFLENLLSLHKTADYSNVKDTCQ